MASKKIQKERISKVGLKAWVAWFTDANTHKGTYLSLFGTDINQK